MSPLGAAPRSDGAPVSPPPSDAPGRQCSRPDCSVHAEVTLTYEYRTSHVWLDTLSPERDPHSYDLCGRHAAMLTAPLGWTVSDRSRSQRIDGDDIVVGERLAG